MCVSLRRPAACRMVRLASGGPLLVSMLSPSGQFINRSVLQPFLREELEFRSLDDLISISLTIVAIRLSSSKSGRQRC